MKLIIPIDRPLKIGFVCSTYGTPAYCHLALELWKRNEPGVKFLLHDDSSPEGDVLRDLALSYGANFVSTVTRKWWYPGDMSAYVEGIQWGDRCALDAVVKCSRRMTLLKPWSANLEQLMQGMQYATASRPCSHYNFGFTSECVALHVPSWINSGACAEMEGHVREGYWPDNNVAEVYYHQLVRKVHRYAHPTEEEVSHTSNANHPDRDYVVHFDRTYIRGQSWEAYAHWQMLGLHRHMELPWLLWHDWAQVSHYAAVARELGLPYTEADFVVPPLV